MLKSSFIYNVLDLLLDSDQEGIFAKGQIDYLEEDPDKTEYTGSGAFYGFKLTGGIDQFSLKGGSAFLAGVEIRSPEIIDTAEAVVHFTEGLISSLEIWCHQGAYPRKQLTHYTLVQNWPGSPGRQIVVT